MSESHQQIISVKKDISEDENLPPASVPTPTVRVSSPGRDTTPHKDTNPSPNPSLSFERSTGLPDLTQSENLSVFQRPDFTPDPKPRGNRTSHFSPKHENRNSIFSHYSGVVEDLQAMAIQPFYMDAPESALALMAKVTIVPGVSRSNSRREGSPSGGPLAGSPRRSGTVKRLSEDTPLPFILPPLSAHQGGFDEGSKGARSRRGSDELAEQRDLYTRRPHRNSLPGSLDISLHTDEETDQRVFNDHLSQISSAYLLPRGSLPTLTVTRKQRIAQTVSPERSATTSLLPSVPARSRQRPVSAIINPTPGELAYLGEEGAAEPRLRQISPLRRGFSQSPSSPLKPAAGSPQRKSQSPRLHPSPVPVMAAPLLRSTGISSTIESFTTSNLASPTRSPTPPTTTVLPQRPSPERIAAARTASLHLEEHRNLSRVPSPSTSLVSFPQSPLRVPVHGYHGEDPNDGYEDVDSNEGRKDPPVPPSGAKKRSLVKRGKSVKPSKKDFSVNRLMRILESTNGTMIGEEFDTLDLPHKEKVLLERIVDALSRLTADMVLDGSRFDEGCVRLQKALNALEGYH